MKALVLEQYGQLEYRDVPTPEPGPGEVLVRVRACGVCGSDVHGMDGSTGRRRPPIIMGHEAAGVIAEVGPGVAGWAAGQRVTFDSTIYCGECWHCRQGEVNLCDRRRVLGVSCDEYRQDGAFAELVAVPARILYALPDAVSFPQAAMVEALSIAAHAVRRSAAKNDESALVVGAGTIGLLAVQLLKVAGCSPVLVADVAEDRLSMARRLGADACIHSGAADTALEVRTRVPRGVDLALEAVGIAASMRGAIDSLRKGGSLTLVGNLEAAVELPLQKVVGREITLRGSCASSGEYPACLELIGRQAVDVDSLISATAPLSEGAAWLHRLYAREPGLLKVVLTA